MGGESSTHVRDEKCIQYFGSRKRGPSEDLAVDGRIILHCILENRVESFGLDASGSRQGPVAGSCEHGNETSSSIKGREIP